MKIRLYFLFIAITVNSACLVREDVDAGRNGEIVTSSVVRDSQGYVVNIVSTDDRFSSLKVRYNNGGSIVDISKLNVDSNTRYLGFDPLSANLSNLGFYDRDTNMVGEWMFLYDTSQTLKARYAYFDGKPSGYVTLYHDYFGSVSDTIFYDVNGIKRWRQTYPNKR